MDAPATEGLLRFFRTINDPRAANARHPMSDVLSIAILAVLCGAEGWAAVEAWGQGNLEWLATFLELPHRIPSHDTFDRVFGLLDPLAFERCFSAWTAALVGNAGGLFVAVDGKTLRRSWRRAWSKTPVHMVSAFASKNGAVLGQVSTDAKSNEITATPKLLAMLELAGLTVTIDAMGCQREIAAQVRRQGGHYVLAVPFDVAQGEDNHPVECLSQGTRLGRGVKLQVELQRCPDVDQGERGLWVANPPKDLFDLAIDVTFGPKFQIDVSQGPVPR